MKPYSIFKKIPAFLLLFVLFSFTPEVAAQSANSITTFILVRHAEKDLTQSTNDPDLSPEGKERAEKLLALLKNADITDIFSTPYKRTTQTVQPLASGLNMEVKHYQRMDSAVFENMIENNPGGKIVVAGHSNTIPELLNYFTGSQQYKVMGEGEYGRLFIVSVNSIGEASVLTINY